jgi:inhibitor of growth protein 3
MLYLEDYLEMIEHLPQELRDRFTEMREMDLQVQNAMDSLEERQKVFFSNAKKMKVEQRDAEFEKIRQDYYKALEDADEKVQIANQIYDLIERYLRRLDQELQKFKMELEADNAGITEVLEKRSLELDNPPPPVNHQPKPEKRRYTIQPGSTSPLPEKRPVSEKVSAVGIPQEIVAPEPVKPRGSTAQMSGVGNSYTPALAPTAGVSYSLGTIGPGSNVIAAAASQAIAATQLMPQGRRTASLKASIEAITAGLPTLREFSIGKDLAANAGLHSASPTPPVVQETTRSGRPKKQSLRMSQAQQQSQSQSYQIQQQQQQQQQQQLIQPVQELPAVVTDEYVDGGTLLDESGQSTDWTYDPNEPRYCICNQVSYGDMVACDNEDCPFEWFHYPCVGITQPPKGKWYCPQCTSAMRRRGRKER